MKYLFNFSKKNDNQNFNKFVIKEADKELIEKHDKIFDEGESLSKEKTMNPIVETISLIVFLCALFIVVSFFASKKGFRFTYENNTILFYVSVGIMGVSGIITFISKILKWRASKDPELEHLVFRENESARELEYDLNIKEDAINMDIIFASTKTDKQGIEKITNTSLINFVNMELKVFIEEDKLCFADIEKIIGIPLDSIKSIEEVNKTIALPAWNKDEETLKKYKLKINGYNMIMIKPYYQVNLLLDNEDYYFYLPSYEIDVFKELIGYNK